jgi:uncharacterized NAD-dependent epimerase/dehydratase family protein
MSFVKKTALVYCDNQFGLMDGKTAAGLVRHSETYNIVGVIDSALAGKDAGEVLDGDRNHIPRTLHLCHRTAVCDGSHG